MRNVWFIVRADGLDKSAKAISLLLSNLHLLGAPMSCDVHTLPSLFLVRSHEFRRVEHVALHRLQ